MERYNKAYICDIETNGLLDVLTKLHVFSICYKNQANNSWEVVSTSSEQDIKKVMEDPNNIVVGHNFFLFDTSALKKLYPDLVIRARIIDTLLLSWVLRPNRPKHGLESYGVEYGVPKPEIEDWENLTYEDYKNRCEEDAKINTNLWYELLQELATLYNDDWDRIDSFINFLMCKGEVYHMQQHNPFRLDLKKTKEYNRYLEALQKEKEEALIQVMPKTQNISKRKKPKTMYKKNGQLSAQGEKWFKLLDMYNLPPDYDGEVEHVTSLADPNPNSTQQVKDWFFSLGWEPEIFNESFSKVTGETSLVPQTKDKEKNLCKSVLKLAEKEPAILQYEDISIIAHRNGYLKGFLKNHVDGNIVADMGGITNCVTADTVITTNRGALPICEVNKEDQVLTHRGVWRNVIDFINNGVRPVYRVITSKGKSIKCTGKHRFYLGEEKWVCAEDLIIGQEVYGYGEKELWKSVGNKECNNFISSWGRYTDLKGRPSYYRKRVHKDVREFCSYLDENNVRVDAQRSRIIAESFFGPSDLHVLHKDGKSCNNNVQNLYYGTDKENHRDTRKHGTLVKAARNRINSKLSNEDVEDIKKRISNGETNKSIAKFYKVGDSYISQIKNNKRRSNKMLEYNTYVEAFEKEFIVSVELVGEMPTFDISVAEDHSYIANGLVTHNTLRIKHRNLVNLPSPSSNYGEYVRSVLLPPEGHIMIGSDLSSLENTTRNNFVYKYDPEFVEAQSHKYYDPHLDIAVISGLMSEDHSNFYKWWKAYQKDKSVECSEIDPNWHWIDGDEEYNENLFHDLNLIRQKAKTVSYSALYGVGAPKLSKELKCSVKEAKSLLDAYWKINWSVKHFASRCKTKTIKDQMWVLNPLNNYWYSLRNEKDIFSTVNQGAGDYIFTLWEKFLMMDGVIIRGGWHDELVTTCKPEDCDKTVAKLYSAIDKVNEVLQLKVPVGIDHKIGDTYADVH